MIQIQHYLDKISRFRSFLGDSVWRLFLLAIFIGFLWFAVESSFLIVIQTILIALNLIPESQGILQDYLPKTVAGASFLLIAYGLFRAVVSVLREYFKSIADQAFIRSQREKLVEFSLHNADSVTSYEVLGVFSDVVNKAGLVVAQMTQLTNVFTSTLLLFILGLKVAPYELLIGVGLLALFIYPVNAISKHISQDGEALMEQWAHAIRVTSLGLKNQFFLRITKMVNHEVAVISKTLQAYEKTFSHYHLFSGIKSNFPIFLGVLVLSAVMFISKSYLATSSAALLSFFYIFIRMSQSAAEGSLSFSAIRVSWPSFMRLYQWHLKYSQMKKETPDADNAEAVISTPSIQLELKEVSFFYSSEKPIFDQFSTLISTGDLVLVQGESGRGKSTLIALILGIILPKKGQVMVNGTPIENLRNALAQQVGYVGPEPFLIPGTVRENLTYGLKKIPKEAELIESLKLACVYDEIMALNHGLDEPLNEATQLSTGQKQRLAIARGYLRHPKILIWDEATANLDSALESRCIENLSKKKDDTLIVVVSHKNSFDHVANRRIDL